MSALLTDLYQLTMLQTYLEEDLQGSATFELFVRRLPPGRNFLVAAGLEQALDYLESLAFEEAEIAWLEAQGGFSRQLLDHLRHLRFEGEVHALPEGTVCFANEPLLRVTAPLPQAQLVESRLLNLVHFQTLIASKAARVVLAAAGRRVVDFGLRRAHGAEAAVLAARAGYLAGLDGTATAEAGLRFGLPVFGTMAHSYVQSHASESQAFLAFARARPQRPTLLVDTYDTDRAVARIVELAPALRAEGIEIGGVRIDSGDLVAQSRAARARLDAGGLARATILVSGNLDEWRIEELLAAGAPIDAFGVGTALVTSADAPALDAVYKLQCYAGLPRRKRSGGKATWPGIKQVVRHWGPDGRMLRDRVQLVHEPRVAAGSGEPTAARAASPAARLDEPLLQPCMRAGRRLAGQPTLAQARQHCAAQLQALPAVLRGLAPAAQPYEVLLSEGLVALAAELDARDA